MEIYIYCLILIAYLVLGFLSADEKGFGFRKMAAYLYRKGKRWGKKYGRLRLFEGSGIRKDISLLYPFGRTGEEEERFYTERIRLVLMILFAGAVLAAAGYAAAEGNLIMTEGNRLSREEVGGEDRSTQVDAYLLTGKQQGEEKEEERTYQGSYTLQVRARKYTKEQTREMADKVFAALPERIRGANESLRNVRSSLELPGEMEGTPFQITWESSSYAMIDADGTVGNLGMGEEDRQDVKLTAVLTYDDGTAAGVRYEKTYDVTVFPPVLDGQERLAEEMRRAITRADAESAAEDALPLPQKVEDRRVIWEERASDPGIALLVFAALTAFLAAAAMGSRLHERVVQRERQMMLDYPGIISKFVLYMGAGLSVRSTFLRIGEDYENRREEGMKERYVYEEILIAGRELTSGVPEAEAYARFGQRCRYRPYTKMSTLLAQNLRKGNSELLTVMQQEAQASFEERRDMARRLGEEAETKLLLPMIAMLTITMLMIIIPAYYSFAA